ncbi:50S ribosomal protein L6 [Holospora curviuscula]|uniref:50S ribosomal protein L6 n=1 Tax=Holospora curviuscula TaxID=1082868 RepID=A0A2S5R8I9_9PROT|nr:50S ribosomal protein L6 [Holospora curviuscula]PPE03644.1 50S ribosomal protein L6 [Holospora curviuscula]
MVENMVITKKVLKIKVPRIASAGITIPQEVKYRQELGIIIFSHGIEEVKRSIPSYIVVTHLDNKFWLTLSSQDSSMLTRKEQRTRISELGTYSSLLKADIEGLVNSFSKTLELVGVGYKVEPHENGIKLAVGYSHDVICNLPYGVFLSVEKPTLFRLFSSNKVLLGHTVSSILKIRQVEPYKGKGIRIQGQYVRMKQGKTK